MKKFLLLTAIAGNVLLSYAQGTITPPTEGVTVEHYSAGAFFEKESDFAWQDGYYVTVVYSNTTNDVWISNLFQDMMMDGMAGEAYKGTYAWLHGTKNGDKITFAKEKVYKATSALNKDLWLAAVDVDANGKETVLDSFDMVVDANGNIKVENPSYYICLLELKLGKPITNEYGIQAEDYALGHEFVHLTEKDLTYPTIPEGVQMKDCTYTTTLYSLGTREKTAQVGFDGNTAYVKGMAAVQKATEEAEWAFPDVVFTGTLADDGQSFTLADGQFYGIYEYLGMFWSTYLWGAKMGTENMDECTITFVKEGDAWKLRSDLYLCRASIVPETIYALESNVSLTPTGESALETIGSEQQDAVQYDLNGQRMRKDTKGIHIVGNRKVFK